MISMTGFGRGRALWDDLAASFTLSCVNKRGREISVNLPRELASMEGEISEMLRKAFDRGKIQLNSRLETSDTSQISPAGLQARIKSLRKNCREMKVPFEPDTRLVWELISTPELSTSATSSKALHAVKAAIADAIKECQTAQSAEGKRLQKDFRARLAELARLHSSAANLAETSLPQRRQRLLKNLTEAGLEIEENDEKLLKELALYADRVDIAEELTRIQSHLHSAQELIQKEGTGRELEFLLQELLREWNTLGNKSQIIELVQTALKAKNEVERLREQAANIA